MTIPAYLSYFVFTGTAVTLLAILYGLHRSLVERVAGSGSRTDVSRLFRHFPRLARRDHRARRVRRLPYQFD